MWYKLKVLKIIKEGIISLIYDLDGKKRYPSFSLWIIVVPLGIGIVSFFKGFIVPHDFANYAITVISIFTALIFGILFIAPDKFSIRTQMYKENKNEEIKNYLIRYKNFTKQFISQVSLIILISIVLIISFALILFVSTSNEISQGNIIFLKIISSIILMSGYIFFMLLLVLLSNIYTMMNDDININIKK